MPAKKESAAVSAFLKALPADRRLEVERVRAVVLRHLPKGYEEAVGGKMLVYQVPLERYPDTYNKQPLWYAALASEKSYLSLHLMPIYGDAGERRRLEAAFEAEGKKPDMGKSCIHFRKADDLPLDAIGGIVASYPVDRWVEIARAARRR
jgi:hypothetical protein